MRHYVFMLCTLKTGQCVCCTWNIHSQFHTHHTLCIIHANIHMYECMQCMDFTSLHSQKDFPSTNPQWFHTHTHSHTHTHKVCVTQCVWHTVYVWHTVCVCVWHTVFLNLLRQNWEDVTQTDSYTICWKFNWDRIQTACLIQSMSCAFSICSAKGTRKCKNDTHYLLRRCL